MNTDSACPCCSLTTRRQRHIPNTSEGKQTHFPSLLPILKCWRWPTLWDRARSHGKHNTGTGSSFNSLQKPLVQSLWLPSPALTLLYTGQAQRQASHPVAHAATSCGHRATVAVPPNSLQAHGSSLAQDVCLVAGSWCDTAENSAYCHLPSAPKPVLLASTTTSSIPPPAHVSRSTHCNLPASPFPGSGAMEPPYQSYPTDSLLQAPSLNKVASSAGRRGNKWLQT